VPRGRLARFFVKEENSYRVSKELRETVIFARQNLIADAPFSRLDLISCRNLLIYLEPEVQQRVLALFHYALVDHGGLFLGSAESIGPMEDLFETVSKKWRIYRRIGPTRHDRLHVPVVAHDEQPLQRESAPAPLRANRVITRVQQMLLDRYAPASVVINRRHEILFFAGPVDLYLTQPPGPPTDDLTARLREGLQSRVRGAWSTRRWPRVKRRSRPTPGSERRRLAPRPGDCRAPPDIHGRREGLIWSLLADRSRKTGPCPRRVLGAERGGGHASRRAAGGTAPGLHVRSWRAPRESRVDPLRSPGRQ
jgi:hypothetical protein